MRDAERRAKGSDLTVEALHPAREPNSARRVHSDFQGLFTKDKKLERNNFVVRDSETQKRKDILTLRSNGAARDKTSKWAELVVRPCVWEIVLVLNTAGQAREKKNEATIQSSTRLDTPWHHEKIRNMLVHPSERDETFRTRMSEPTGDKETMDM